MSLTVFPIPGFAGGLNLRDQPNAVDPSQAIDAMNVTFTDRGAVEQRAGYDNLTSALTNAVASIEPFYTTSGTAHLIAGCGTRLEAILGSDGSVVASDTGNTAGIWDFARFGTPGNEYVYAGNSANNLHRWTGSVWSDLGAGSPEAGALAVTPADNRLVAARFTSATGGPAGATANPSYVWFSDEGAAETWTASSYIQVAPGDGEGVTAVVAWDRFVFIFKESSYYVYYGTSTDTLGNPVFDFTPIRANAGALGPRAACAGRDGVYFVSRNGVYRATGPSSPELLSDAIDPIFDTQTSTSDYYLGGTLLQSQAANTAITYHNERIYVGFTSTGTANDRTLEYDPRYGWWTISDIPAACLCSFRVASSPELIFADTTNKIVYRHKPSYTSDNGTAISSRWRSGWDDHGSPAEKRLRWTMLWGEGTPKVAVSTDFATDPGTLAEVDLVDDDVDTWGGTTWGGGEWARPAGLIEGLVNRSSEGVVFSTYFSNNVLDTPWSVSRAEHHISSVRHEAAISVP